MINFIRFMLFAFFDVSRNVTSTQKVSRITALVCCALCLNVGVLEACPSSVFASDFTPTLQGNRANYFLLVRRPSLQAPGLSKRGARDQWRRLPLQIDPVSDDGRILYFPDESWKRQDLEKHDRMVFYVNQFGKSARMPSSFPCFPSRVSELRDKINPVKFAYLVHCQQPHLAEALPFVDRSRKSVSYDAVRAEITGENYRYAFNVKNHLLFRQIYVGKNHDRFKIAQDSDISIHANVRNFFNFNFSAEDIESYLEDVRVGEVGVNARLSFYLKIMYIFKVKLELSTDVSFYGDSANIPMLITMPIDSQKNLNPGSGLIYSWVFDPRQTRLSLGLSIPRLTTETAKLAKSRGSKFVSLGTASCGASDLCYYRLGMEAGRHKFVMDFKIRRSLVEKGFFPMFAADITTFSDYFDWRMEAESKRAGIYFESSGLNVGSYPWDFWMRLGTVSTLKSKCPHPIYARPFELRKNKLR